MLLGQRDRSFRSNPSHNDAQTLVERTICRATHCAAGGFVAGSGRTIRAISCPGLAKFNRPETSVLQGFLLVPLLTTTFSVIELQSVRRPSRTRASAPSAPRRRVRDDIGARAVFALHFCVSSRRSIANWPMCASESATAPEQLPASRRAPHPTPGSRRIRRSAAKTLDLAIPPSGVESFHASAPRP